MTPEASTVTCARDSAISAWATAVRQARQSQPACTAADRRLKPLLQQAHSLRDSLPSVAQRSGAPTKQPAARSVFRCATTSSELPCSRLLTSWKARLTAAFAAYLPPTLGLPAADALIEVSGLHPLSHSWPICALGYLGHSADGRSVTTWCGERQTGSPRASSTGHTASPALSVA